MQTFFLAPRSLIIQPILNPKCYHNSILSSLLFVIVWGRSWGHQRLTIAYISNTYCPCLQGHNLAELRSHVMSLIFVLNCRSVSITKKRPGWMESALYNYERQLWMALKTIMLYVCTWLVLDTNL